MSADSQCKLCNMQVATFDGVATCENCGLIDRSRLLKKTSYPSQGGRNFFSRQYIERKLYDRLTSLECHGFSSKKIMLDVGCAEGELGLRLKQLSNWTIHGVEISKDLDIAASRLDQTYGSVESVNQAYDLVTCFHVIEHVEDLTFLSSLSSLIAPEGKIIIEVPHKTGHRFVGSDGNVEHIFSFSLRAMSLLAEKSDLVITESTTGHFESPAYSDCLRITCVRNKDFFRYSNYHDISEALLEQEVIIYGTGGDFRSYVKPILPNLNIAGFYSSSETGDSPSGMMRFASLPPELHTDKMILIASIKYEDEMREHLMELGWPSSQISSIGQLLDGLVLE